MKNQQRVCARPLADFPLSSAQKEIWFDQLLHPDRPLYNIGGYVRIDGPMDVVLFERALNQLVEEMIL